MSIDRDHNVLTEAQPVPGKYGVGANAPPLEPVVPRCAFLIEVIEGDTVGVVVAAARYIHVVIPNLRRTEDGFPPVGTGAPGHDQTVGVGIRRLIHSGRPSPR